MDPTTNGTPLQGAEAGNTTHQLDSAQLLQEHQQQGRPQPPTDPNLSSILAFNQSYGQPQQDQPERPEPNSHDGDTNQWGKRPAPIDGTDANKRPHLENGAVVMTAEEEAQLAAQLQAHNGHREYEDEEEEEEEMVDDDDVDDPDYVMDEEENDREHRRMQAELDAAHGGNPWGNPMNMMDQGYALWDAKQKLRIMSLPILDNLSNQILQTLGKGPYQDTINIVTQPESGEGQAYNTMKSLFDHTKKLYTQEAFLSADELKLSSPDQHSTIRKVNLATFVSSVFGSQEVGFFHLNEHFLDTFVPDGGRLLKSQGSLFLDLKTQAYISAMSTNERTKEEILEDLFPSIMTEILLGRRPGAKQLTPSEQDFVHRLIHRRQHLMEEQDDDNLGEKYIWQDFLKEVSWYVSKNHETIVAQPTRRARKRLSEGSDQRPNMSTAPLMSQPVGMSIQQPPMDPSFSQPLHHSPHAAPEMGSLETEIFGNSSAYNMGAPPLAQPPVPQQSQPTQVLYERARLAATSKSSPNARRAGLPSQRRPWTTEEENALMAGLDRVKGPHWSQILAMFGPGGTVSEALKDRNQVQLKDKARNLKLFFLKSGIEVPYYLQFVTGELKTRAPGQAAKNAAKKAVEASAEEDAAHVAAVTALGNAHRAGSNDGGGVVATVVVGGAGGGGGAASGQVAPQAPMMAGSHEVSAERGT